MIMLYGPFCFVVVWAIAYLVIRKRKYFLGSEELSRFNFWNNEGISLLFMNLSCRESKYNWFVLI